MNRSKKIKFSSAVLLVSVALALTGCSGPSGLPEFLDNSGNSTEHVEKVETPEDQAVVLSSNSVVFKRGKILEVEIERADGSKAICFVSTSIDGGSGLECPEWAQKSTDKK